MAIVLGGLSLQLNNVANQAPPAMNSIAWDQADYQIFTNKSQATATLYMEPSGTQPEGHYVPNESWIYTLIDIDFPEDGPFEWAIALGSYVSFPGCDSAPGRMTSFPDAATALKHPDRNHAPWVSGSENPVYYQNEVSWPGDMKPCGGATVIYGSGSGRYVDLEVHTPAEVPLVKESGQFVGVKTPRMGRARRPDGTRVDRPLSAKLPNSAVAEKEWLEPARVEFEFNAEGLGEMRQDSGTPPTEPFGLKWRAQDELGVSASLTRPSVAVRNQQFSFSAGILISLAASFFVWGLELLANQHRGLVAFDTPQTSRELAVTPSEIRKWASARGYSLKKHGPIPAAVRSAFVAEHHKQDE
jgi:hypothetical protein